MLDKNKTSLIKEIISKHLDLRKCSVFIFGSRAQGTSRKFSDVDIGIESDKNISDSTLIKIEEDLENSDLPFTVDVIDFSKVNDSFKNFSKKQTISLN